MNPSGKTLTSTVDGEQVPPREVCCFSLSFHYCCWIVDVVCCHFGVEDVTDLTYFHFFSCHLQTICINLIPRLRFNNGLETLETAASQSFYGGNQLDPYWTLSCLIPHFCYSKIVLILFAKLLGINNKCLQKLGDVFSDDVLVVVALAYRYAFYDDWAVNSCQLLTIEQPKWEPINTEHDLRLCRQTGSLTTVLADYTCPNRRSLHHQCTTVKIEWSRFESGPLPSMLKT